MQEYDNKRDGYFKRINAIQFAIRTNNQIEMVIKTNDRGKCCCEPIFAPNRVILFPVPEKLQEKAHDYIGVNTFGHFGRREWDTNKSDKTGRPIYVRYFIPMI